MSEGGTTTRKQISLDFRHLTKDELAYELDIRGIPHQLLADPKELYTLLYKHRLRDEEASRIEQLDPEEEVKVLAPKISELQALYLEAKVLRNYIVQPSRLASLFFHVSYRLRRVQYRARGETYEKMEELARTMFTLHGLLSELFPDVEFRRFPLPSEEIEEILAATKQLQIDRGRREKERDEGVRGSAHPSSPRDRSDREAQKERRKATRSPERRERRGSPDRSVRRRSRGQDSTPSSDRLRKTLQRRREEKPSSADGTSSDTDSSTRTDSSTDRRSASRRYRDHRGHHRKSRGKKSRRKNSQKKKSRKKQRDSRRMKNRHDSSGSSSSTSQTETDTSVDSSSESSDTTRGAPTRHRNPVATWKLKFTGTEDLLSFLEGAEELAEIHSVRKADLLIGISALLDGDAKVWFKERKTVLTTWEAFKKMIRKAFLPNDGDDAVLEKLRRMRQRSTETYEVFEARMGECFRRLNEPLSEKKKLEFLMAGLTLYYRSKICEADITSLTALRRTCRKYEVDKVQIQKLEKERDKSDRDREKPRPDKNQEERFHRRSDVPRKAWNVNSVEEPDGEASDVLVEATTFPGGARNAIRCWRCGKFGDHISTHCKEKIFCIACGQPDVIAERCPRCAAAQAQGLWTQQNFPQGAWSWGNQVPPRFPYPPPQHPNCPPPFPTHLQRPSGMDQTALHLLHSTSADSTQPLRPTRENPFLQNKTWQVSQKGKEKPNQHEKPSSQ